MGREEEWDGMRRVTGGGVGREEWFWSISAFEIVRKFFPKDDNLGVLKSIATTCAGV